MSSLKRPPSPELLKRTRRQHTKKKGKLPLSLSNPRSRRLRRRQVREKLPPHEIVWKEIHGQMMPVKVFTNPMWAKGHVQHKEALGFPPSEANSSNSSPQPPEKKRT